METNFKEIDFKCVSCDSHRGVFYINKDRYDIYRCSVCGMLSVFPIPTNVAKVYQKDYFSGGQNGFGYVNYDTDKEAMRGVFTDYLNITDKLGGKGNKKLLDIGAATGFFVRMANDFGFLSSGLEISNYAANLGRQNGLDIKTGTLENVTFKNEAFDVVTMWDVIEHMPNPKANLELTKKYLKKGGVLAINTPDSGSLYAKILGKRWHLFVPPEHIHYFNKKSLEIILEKTGFEIMSFMKIGKKFTIEYVFQILSKWLNISVFKRISQFLGKGAIGKIAIPINLRDNVVVFAKKK